MKFAGIFLLFLASALGQPAYQLVLKGGRVIDPKNNIDGQMDVGVHDGRIAAVGANLKGERTIDVGGLIVTPGLVDIHAHVYFSAGNPNAWAGDNSVQPDAFSFRTGVTTMVDAGSAGWRNFEAFRGTVIDRAATRIFAFINIAGLGMVTNAAEQADFNPKEVARLARKHKDVVVGVKTAHYELPGWDSVDQAIEAGKESGLPIMVDFGHFRRERPYWKLVTERLRPGDISTHMFRGTIPFLDKNGKLYPYLFEARKRGVIFDVGHGGGSFVFRNAFPAVAQGFYPDSISSDLHALSMNAGMVDMPTTMGKFLMMGMPLKDIVRASTWEAARIINRTQVGHLSVGAPADITVWKLVEGEFGFVDSFGGLAHGQHRFQCELTLKDGQVVWDWNGRAATDFRKLDPSYGIRHAVEELVLPK